jgi:hypothetical protein
METRASRMRCGIRLTIKKRMAKVTSSFKKRLKSHWRLFYIANLELTREN